MKNPSLLFHKLSWGPWLWLAVHVSIPLLLLLTVFFWEPVRINTRLFDMLPQPVQSRIVMEADAILVEKNERELVILSAAPDFESAKEGAVMLGAEFERSADFEAVSVFFDSGAMSEFYEYLFNYRFVIAGKETVGLLESGKAEEIASDALAYAFGFFNFIPLDNIEKDPFLLAERRTQDFFSSSLLASGNMSLKDGVLAAEQDKTWYVLIRLTLAPNTVSLQTGKNTIGKIYSAAGEIKESMPELEFYFSGIPFHSYESSSGAQMEISIISIVTLSIILLLFLFVFRFPAPVIFTILDTILTLGLAAAAALLIFREIHIITFVFGTTLIGNCVDYSIHYFVHWKGNPSMKDGFQIRSHISKSIIMCFISTEICFLIFFFTSFPILKQFAVFAMAGLLSSFLTAFFIYPLFKMPEENKRHFRFFDAKIFRLAERLSMPRNARIAVAAALAVVVITLLAFNFRSVKIENNISSLYTMSDTLMESEIRTAQVLDYGSSGWYFIVSGSSPEETLENEERLIQRLEKEIIDGNLGSILATSIFVPSIKQQKKTYEAMTALLPLAHQQFEYLGFPSGYAESFYSEFSAAERYCLPEDAPSIAGISNLWIGEHDGYTYSCVMPLKPAYNREDVFRSIAGEFEFAHFINKAKDISNDLDTLTETMLIFFLAACVIIFILIFIIYPWRDSLRICAVPVFLILAAVTILTLNNIPISFFFITALVLAFGLGLDYMFYMTGKKHEERKHLTRLAVVLSFLTTLLSFGALGFSSFMPVHIFGLTVSAGLGAAFIFTMLLQTGKE